MDFTFQGLFITFYHNYLKKLISIHDRECEMNGVTFHYATIVKAYLDRRYHDR